MRRDDGQRLLEQALTRLDPVPWRGARRMRQRHEVARMTVVFYPELPADDVGKFIDLDELGDREFAHGNHEAGLKQLEFAAHPLGAGGDLLRIRDAVAPC